MSKVTVTKSKTTGANPSDVWDEIRFKGAFEEGLAAALEDAAQGVGKKVVFNFRDVNRVNSSGIRDWILFLRDFEPGRELVFDECSPTVVMQMNMIPGFHDVATVRSVYAPFACTSCRTAKLEKFEGPKFPQSNARVPHGKCDKCQGETKLADNAVEYFDFANP
jgi:hypothetical protein